MKLTLAYLQQLAGNIKTLTQLRFFKLLVAITIILILTILLCIYTCGFNIVDLSLTQFEFLLEPNHFIILLDGGIFTLSLNINHSCTDPNDFGSYFTSNLINTLKRKNIKIRELSETESTILQLTTKYGPELCESTINNIIKQYDLIKGDV